MSSGGRVHVHRLLRVHGRVAEPGMLPNRSRDDGWYDTCSDWNTRMHLLIDSKGSKEELPMCTEHNLLPTDLVDYGDTAP